MPQLGRYHHHPLLLVRHPRYRPHYGDKNQKGQKIWRTSKKHPHHLHTHPIVGCGPWISVSLWIVNLLLSTAGPWRHRHGFILQILHQNGHHPRLSCPNYLSVHLQTLLQRVSRHHSFFGHGALGEEIHENGDTVLLHQIDRRRDLHCAA